MHCIWCAGFTKLSAAADPVSEPSRVKLSEVAKNSSSSFSSAVSFFNESHINFSYRTFDFVGDTILQKSVLFPLTKIYQAI